MTGAELKRYFYQKVDKDYTGYLDNTKLNRLFKDTIYRVVNERIDNLGIQKNFDEISFLIKTKQTSINNNKLGIAPVPIVSVTIADIYTYEITFGNDHNLVAGDTITISGVDGTGGITNCNDTYTPTIVDSTTIQITGGGSYSWLTTSGVHVPNTGQMVFAKMVWDYYRLYTLSMKYYESPKLTIDAASNTSVIRCSVVERNNLRSGDNVEIAGVAGNTNANGTFYIRKLFDKTFELYSDAALITPVSSNGIYTGGGELTRTYYKYAKPYYADEKISPLSRPTITNPKFEMADKFIVAFPSDRTCSEVTIQYFCIPKEVDVADASTNLTLYYNDKFLYYIVDSAAKIFGQMIRDNELYQTMSNETQINK